MTTSFTRHQAVGAYRRWTPPDFGAPPEPAPEPEPPEPPKPLEALPEADFPEQTLSALPTVAELEQIHDEAHRNGFDEGFAEGNARGYTEGKETGFREGREAGFLEGSTTAQAEARQVQELLAQLTQSFAKLDTEVAEELMSLSIELARKILQHTLAVDPASIASTLRAALQNLPQIRVQIHLNPADVALVRKHLNTELEQEGHLLLEDETISRGGCRMETPGAHIDATMETRWRRVLESLGREHAPWTAVPERRTKTRRGSDKADKGATEEPGNT